MQQQQTLPPKFLQPIYRPAKNVVIRREPQILPVKVEQGEPYVPPPGATFSPESFGAESYNTGAEYMGGEQYTGGY